MAQYLILYIILLVEEYNYEKLIAMITRAYFNKVLYILFLFNIYKHLHN